MPSDHEADPQIARALLAYRDAWSGQDLAAIIAAYHEDFVLHYFGTSPLAGTHEGKEQALQALGRATAASNRRLVEVEDVLVGQRLGALVATEELGDPARTCRRVLVYRVEDGLLRECWLYDEDQRFIDALWSQDPA